jgi:hypothetical protein
MQLVPSPADVVPAVGPSPFNDSLVVCAPFDGEKEKAGCTITVEKCKFHSLILRFEQPYDEPKALVENVFQKVAFIETEDVFPTNDESTMLRKLAVRRLVARDVDRNIIFTLNGWTIKDYLLAFKALEPTTKEEITYEAETGNPDLVAEIMRSLELAAVPVKKETRFNKLLGVFGKK